MQPIDNKESQAQLLQFFQKRKYVINEKLKRCRQFKNLYPTKTYQQNSPKQQLVLEHVIQFKKQFQQHIGQNRQLFLYPKNQCDVYKFICTTIRPTKLGFLELYHYEECAQRISKFIQYEQLDPPDQFPKCIPSPANVSKWQKGDCFDISILLVSLLIGVGYDAYCVYGIAPKQISSKNQALMQCDYLHELREKSDESNHKIQSKLDDGIIQKRITESEYDRNALQKQKKQAEQLAHKALTIDDDEPDELTPDLYLGRRLHAWVLIKKGKRGVTSDVFIQPSTGKLYDIKNSPYLLVDAIFNNTNFFIHMQPKHKVEEIKFELYQTITWQYVMLHEQLFHTAGQDDNHDLDQNSLNKINDEEDKLNYLAQTLDMPPPWSPKINIEKDKFIMGMPLGETTTFYIRLKVQKYAEYSQHDGLVLKYTLYEDFKKIKVKQIGYFYKHRSDNLDTKYRYPFQFKTVQYYGPGKMPHWKNVTEIDRRMRIIVYYPNRNEDGLMRRIQKVGEKTVQYYENRDDLVTSRSVNFSKTSSDRVKTPKDYFYEDSHVGKVNINKMTQTFQKNMGTKSAKEQIAKMTVDILKEKVIVFYHMDEGEIQPIKKEYSRDQILGFGKIDTNQKKNDDLVQRENSKLSQMEKDCYQMIKTNELRSSEEYRQIRFGVLMINKTLYDKAREKFKQNRNKVDEEIHEDDQNDFLRPFLEKRRLSVNQPVTTYELAMQIKNEVLQKMKERIIARAKIIQERLQKQQDHLKQLNDQFQKKQEQKNEKELGQVKFKISILQSRSSRFQSMAITKFQQMDQKINQDARLAILKSDKK